MKNLQKMYIPSAILMIVIAQGCGPSESPDESPISTESPVTSTPTQTATEPTISIDKQPLLGEYSVTEAHSILLGTSGGDRAGISTSAGLDVTGDGIGDLLIGTYSNDDYDLDAGTVYLFHGPVVGKMNVSAAAVRLYGEARGNNAGVHSTLTPDMTGDSRAEILIGALQYETRTGAVYLVSDPQVTEMNLSEADVKMVGENTEDGAGRGTYVGDINADGAAEIIVSASNYDVDDENVRTGKVYILQMPEVGSEFELGNSPIQIIGQPTEHLGISIGGLGDINGDGILDVGIGASIDLGQSDDPGRAYIFHGPIPDGTMQSSAAQTTIFGEGYSDSFALHMCPLGDINGDGIDDLAISDWHSDQNGKDAGAVYVFYGPILEGAIQAINADLTVLGPEDNAYLHCVQGARGDINGDGYNDLILSASGAAETRGQVYLWYGGENRGAQLYVDSADAIFTGEVEGDNLDNAVLGDIDGDGLAEVVLSAYNNSENDFRSGAVYIFYGSR